jgi:hypothetical protein
MAPGAGQVQADAGGNQRRARDSLCDAAFEARPRRERLVHVQRIAVARELGEFLDFCIAERLC